MKDKVAYEQPSSAGNLRQAIKEVSITEIIQAVIDRKIGHTKYWKVVALTRLDVIKFQIVLYYAFWWNTLI